MTENPMTTLYGLKTCDTCRKALKSLRDAGQEVALHDVRAEPLDDATRARFLEVFGNALVNTKSTTWRGLSDEQKALPEEALLTAYPALMKRPVIDGPGGLTLGWTTETQARQLGTA